MVLNHRWSQAFLVFKYTMTSPDICAIKKAYFVYCEWWPRLSALGTASPSPRPTTPGSESWWCCRSGCCSCCRPRCPLIHTSWYFSCTCQSATYSCRGLDPLEHYRYSQASWQTIIGYQNTYDRNSIAHRELWSVLREFIVWSVSRICYCNSACGICDITLSWTEL